jgi:hypothetical protein
MKVYWLSCDKNLARICALTGEKDLAPDDWILSKDSRGYSKSIWALSDVVSAKRTPTPIRRTGFPAPAKAWPRRDRRHIHKLLVVSCHPQKFPARGRFSRKNFNLDDHF